MATTKKPTATKTATVRARIEPDLKVEAESILAALGLNATDAIRLFYTQITLANGLPFNVRVSERRHARGDPAGSRSRWNDSL